MQLFAVSEADGLLALRALKAVAMANGVFAEEERTLLDAARRLYAPGVALDAITPVAPADLAAGVTDPAARRQILQACLIMAVADGEATPDEGRYLAELREALGVDDDRMAVFQRLAQGQRQLAQIELAKRISSPAFKKVYGEQGVGGVYKLVKTARGTAPEELAVAWRYRKLGLLPEGTLGREFWKHVRERDFAFPGETGGPPEALVAHDFAHVLTGYDTDPAGEFQLAAFTAGMRREDPFGQMFFVMLQSQVGLGVAAPPPAESRRFDPARVLEALARGAACTTDLSAGWDHWTVIGCTVEELRERYAIKPA